MSEQPGPWPPTTILDWVNGGAVNTDRLVEEMQAWVTYFRPVKPHPEDCSQCTQPYKVCKKCQEKIVFVPKAGFGSQGEWRHLAPPVSSVPHLPHPELVIT